MIKVIKESDTVVSGKVHEVMVKRLRFICKKRIPKGVLSTVKIEFYRDKFLDELVFQWRAVVAGQGLRTIRYPKDWWQAFKERWLPKIFRKWWPVEYKIIDIYALYPSIAMPNKFTGIHIQEGFSKEENE